MLMKASVYGFLFVYILENMCLVLVIMGVSGCGKTTIGELLANKLQCEFIDADSHHSETSILKMKNGLPLNDQDRKTWLKRLRSIVQSHISEECRMVLACSALKKVYRDQLRTENHDNVHFVYLKGTKDQISERLALRKGHYMPESLLQSQFDTLEEPMETIEKCVTVHIQQSADVIVKELIVRLELL